MDSSTHVIQMTEEIEVSYLTMLNIGAEIM